METSSQPMTLPTSHEISNEEGREGPRLDVNAAMLTSALNNQSYK